MQINTVWLSELKQYGIDEQSLIWEPCTNIAVGTWILATRYYEFGNWPDAIKSYNAGYNLNAGAGYAEKVVAKLELFQKEFEHENHHKK